MYQSQLAFKKVNRLYISTVGNGFVMSYTYLLCKKWARAHGLGLGFDSAQGAENQQKLSLETPQLKRSLVLKKTPHFKKLFVTRGRAI